MANETPTERLINAARYGDEAGAVRALRAGAKVNGRDEKGRTPLMEAAGWGQPRLVRLLLNAGAALEARDREDATALYLAARKLRPDAAYALLQAGADPNARARYGRTALMEAVRFKERSLAPMLLRAGADVRAAAESGDTALHEAAGAVDGDADFFVRLLLSRGAAPNARGAFGRTSLQLAALFGFNGAVKHLLQAGADPDQPDESGVTSLAQALVSGRWETIRLLLEGGADIRRVGQRGMTALHIAVSKYDDTLAPYLDELAALGLGADVRAEDGLTPLMSAAIAGNEASLRWLLAHGAAPNVVREDGATALTMACLYGRARCVRALIRAAADVNAVLPDGRTPLILGAGTTLGDAAATVAALVAAGADVTRTDARGRTAAEVAAEQGRPRIVALLEASAPRHWAAPRSSNAVRAALTEAAREGAVDRLRHLLRDAGRLPPLLVFEAFKVACNERKDEAAAFIARHGLDPNIEDEKGFTPLTSCMYGRPIAPALVRALLAAGADPARPAAPTRILQHVAGSDDYNFYTDRPITYSEAEQADLALLARELIEAGADPCATDRKGRTPLSYAVVQRDQGMVALLMEHECAADIEDGAGRSPLFYAVGRRLQAMPIVEMLLGRGADPAKEDAQGHSPLSIAARLPDPAVFERLRAFLDPTQRPDAPALVPAFLSAAAEGRRETVVRLLRDGVPADAMDEDGRTALLEAIKGRHRDVANALLNMGADPLRADAKGRAPIHEAAYTGDARLVERLLDAGAPLDQPADYGRTPLMLAVAGGHPELVEFLLQRGADARHVAEWGQNVLQIMANSAQYNAGPDVKRMVETLLEAGADLEQANGDDETALHIAAGARVYLPAGSYEETEGLLAMVRALLAGGANPRTRNAQGRTPLDDALRLRLQKVAALLEEAGG